MSIAFQALVLLVLALPGIIFFRHAARANLVRERRAIAEELAKSIAVAAVLHAVWLQIWWRLAAHAGLGIDLNVVTMLAMGQYGHDDAQFSMALKRLTEHPDCILLYFASLCLFAGLFGRLFGIAHVRWKRRKKVDRFAKFACQLFIDDPVVERWDDWYDHLNSHIDAGYAHQILGIVVEQGGEAYLYVGLFLEAFPGDDGNPDRFLLGLPARRLLKNDNDPLEPFESETLLIPASQCLNINQVYVAIDEEGGGLDETVPDDAPPVEPGEPFTGCPDKA